MRCSIRTIHVVCLFVVCGIGSTGCGTGAKNGATAKGTVPAGSVTGVSADQVYAKVADGPSHFNVVGPKKNAGDFVILTITVSPGTNESLIDWGGADEVPGSPLQAKVPIGASVIQNVTVIYGGIPCQQIKVWPVWVELEFHNTGTGLDTANNPVGGLRVPGLGVPPRNTTPPNRGTFNQIEIKGIVSPAGVAAIDPPGSTTVQFDFKRSVQSQFWQKFVGQPWNLNVAQSHPAGDDDDGSNNDEDLHDGNDVIWVNDTPGLPLVASNGQIEGVQIEWQFGESVMLILNQSDNTVTPMTGPVVSRNRLWYSILYLKAVPGDGQLDRGSSPPNRIEPGSITFGSAPIP